jgi:hypothetical protein
VRRLLPLLLLLLTGAAYAAGPPLECAAPSLNPGNLSMTAFLPNAPCLLARTVASWGEWGLWTGMSIVGITLIAILFFWKLFQAVMSGTPEKALMPFVFAVVLVAFMAPAREGGGIIPDLQAQAMESFVTLYSASASVGNRALVEGPRSVQETTRTLGRSIALLVARGSQAESIRKQMQAIKAGELAGDLKDPNLVNTLYAQQIAKETEGIGGLFTGNDWIFNVGFLLLYGLFALFSGMIYAIGFGMQLALLLAPVALPFMIMGRWQPITIVGGTYFAALLTVAVLPIAVATVATVGLAIPAEVLTPTVTRMNSDVAADLTLYQANLDRGCSWTEVACQMEQSVLLPILSDLSSLKELFVQMLLMMAALIIGLSIAASTLRRVPGQIAGMFGMPGGGESSGVETGAMSKVLGGAAKMLGGQMLMRAAQQRMMGGLAGKVKGQDGAGGDASSATSGGTTEGGHFVPPPDVTDGPGSGASTASDVPPPGVTSTGASAPDLGASAFQGGARTPLGSAYVGYRAARDSGQGVPSSLGAGAQLGRAHVGEIAGAGLATAGGAARAYTENFVAQENAGLQRVKNTVSTSLWGGVENAQRHGGAINRGVGAVVSDARQVARDSQQRQAANAVTIPGPRNPDENELHPRVTQQEAHQQNMAVIAGNTTVPDAPPAQHSAVSAGRLGSNIVTVPPSSVQDGTSFTAGGTPVPAPSSPTSPQVRPNPAPSSPAGAAPAPAPAPVPTPARAAAPGWTAPSETERADRWASQGPHPAAPPGVSAMAQETHRSQARAESNVRPAPGFGGPGNRNLYAASRAVPGATAGPLLPSPAPTPAPAPQPGPVPNRNAVAAQRQGGAVITSAPSSVQDGASFRPPAPAPAPAPAPSRPQPTTPTEKVAGHVEDDRRRGKA